MNPLMTPWRAALASAAAAALLAACGGGGDSASSSATPASLATGVQVTTSAPVPQTAAATGTVVDATADPERKPPGQARTKTNKAYIVQLAEMPVTAYDGSIKGLNATRPKKGQKIDPDSPAVTAYMGYLASRHDSVLANVGQAKKLYSYGYVFNGFAAELTDAQVARLSAMKGVLAVTKDEARQVDTASTPAFLGLSGAGGFYATTGAKGENVIIGIVDGGIWPEHPSFTDRVGMNGNASKDGKLGYQQIPGWHGKCVPGEQFTGTDCNQKLIGARYYNAGWGGNAGIDESAPNEFNSPRDWGGHGTHTASTAGGNAGVTVTGPAASYGTINGIAPRARIAAYKVCWDDASGAGGSCFNSDSVAAIDQAVADGVDVINFSVGGSRTNFRDPVEIAFLFAADAGVFVATSAGNSGPATQTVAHPGPWVTTVAAGTHNRSAIGTVTLGNNATYTGASVASALPSALLVNAVDAGLAGANPTAVRLCFSTAWNGTPVLDPAKIAGKIVICDRGTSDRVDKSRAVKEAGGIGMVMTNTTVNSLNADFHSVPTVHISNTDGALVKAYAAAQGTNATASIGQATLDFSAAAPFTASFSSRGPLLAAAGDLLKPDIIAPGQDILAAVAPPGNGGRSFDLYSGTSMSSPHIAGIAALFKEAKPGWSPMAIKSAIMTTAYDILDGPNTHPLVIFRQGAGHVKPVAALDPGLVFDSGFADWLGFLCGTQLPASFCTSSGIPVLDASDMNVASIAVGDLPGAQTVTRTVTNVGATAATYSASVSGLNGLSVAMSPASFTIQPGAKQKVAFTITRTGDAALLSYTGGQLTLSDGSHNVRVPMVIRPVALGAPPEAGGPYQVNFGYTGAFTVAPRGLVSSAASTGPITTNVNADINVVVPAGTTYARFSTFDGDMAAPTDLDLEVYLDGVLVGSSGGPTAAEEVNLSNPAAGTYKVRVVGFAVPGTLNYQLHSWVLGSAAEGNMTVSAPGATSGTSGTVTVTTSGLVPGKRYLGSVVYGGTTNLPPPTIIRIDR